MDDAPSLPPEGLGPVLGQAAVNRASAGSKLVEAMGRWASLKGSRQPEQVVAREIAKGRFVSAATDFAVCALNEKTLLQAAYPDHASLWQDLECHPVMDEASAHLTELGLL